MPVRPATSYPGVYVQEVPSGVRTITGVGTSICMFIGAAKRGPINLPERCLNYKAFSDLFGEDASTGQLAQYVKLFFLNGGTDCYVMRIANTPVPSSVTLRNEQDTAEALILTAKDKGLDGENIRAIVTYGGTLPEATFNVELYAWALQSGQRVKTRREVWKNLSMDPSSSSFAPTFLTQNSKIAEASLPAVQAPLTQGISQSGRPVPHNGSGAPAVEGAAFLTAWKALIGSTTTTNKFLLNIDGSGFNLVDLSKIDFTTILVPTAKMDLADKITNEIINQFANNYNIPGLKLNVAFVPGPPPSPKFPGTTVTTLLQISSRSNGDVFIRPAGAGDLAVPLMLGSEQGGLEIAAHAPRRPAPNGISLLADTATPLVPPPVGWNTATWLALANLQQQAFTPVANGITLDEFLPPPASGTVPVLIRFNDLVTNTPADLFYRDNNAGSPNGNNDGLRDKLGRMAAAINNRAANNPLFRWSAQVAGTRLTILPTENVDDNFNSPSYNVTGFAAANFLNNVKSYTLGAGGFSIGARQVPGATGSDGTSPRAVDYDAAYLVIDKEVDLFNLMVLPPVANLQVEAVYGNASVYCQSRRAFLLMDPPTAWTSPQAAVSGLTILRTGLVKDYSAVFYPRITIDEGGLKQNVGPAGALAGLFARIDSTRGVWKAPAGTEADLRGIVGLEEKLSDGENGILNRRAINTLRIFPSGIVNWGARTNYGDDDTPHDYKYIPIRRLALFMEESLYRGLKWVVFEPNDEPLWSQIRLNVGSFMHDLFRQGAFQGSTPKDAYFVKCDSETTTQNDRNLGCVNIWVGFAPLKPAEFVIIYLQQMAGQIQV